jgi:hypothetical protein
MARLPDALKGIKSSPTPRGDTQPAFRLPSSHLSNFEMAHLTTAVTARRCFRPLGSAEALNSPEGFRHYNKWECEKSARDGCAICMMIVQRALRKWRQHHGLVFFTTLNRRWTWRMFEASEPECRENAVPVRFDGLSGWTADPARDTYIVSLVVYTTEGKTHCVCGRLR